jgi:hypothetical protein
VKFRHTLVPSAVENERAYAKKDPLLHNPTYDVDIRIIGWVWAEKLFSRFDDLV